MPRGRTEKTLAMVAECRQILEAIQPATTRAVCYQLFIRELIANVGKTATNRISDIMTRAREQGDIPWAWIVDEHRDAEVVPSWDDPAEYADAVLSSYRRNRWQYQPRRIEVWSEKGTVRGTLRSVLHDYGVTFRVMHGYSSASVVKIVAQESSKLDEPLLVFYVGDWDPSGLHMSEVDLPKRLQAYGGNVEIRRLALTQADATAGGLPSFPASSKRSDTRYQWFTRRYGDTCWELDALSPALLRDRISVAIWTEIDREAWYRAEEVEAVERESLEEVLENWRAII